MTSTDYSLLLLSLSSCSLVVLYVEAMTSATALLPKNNTFQLCDDFAWAFNFLAFFSLNDSPSKTEDTLIFIGKLIYTYLQII